MQVHSFTFNPFMENTYVVCDKQKKGAIIDPGCYEAREQQILIDFIESEGITIEKIINTHCHIDHVLGNTWAKNTYMVPLLVGKKEAEMLKAVESYAPNYGFQHYAPAEPDEFLEESGTLNIGEESLDILFVPGHSPGHLAFYSKKHGFVIGGDVLFERSIGRTDLPGGDHDTLIQSIHNHFFTLPDNTLVYCGHGNNTTIGVEKKENPFCAEA